MGLLTNFIQSLKIVFGHKTTDLHKIDEIDEIDVEEVDEFWDGVDIEDYAGFKEILENHISDHHKQKKLEKTSNKQMSRSIFDDWEVTQDK